MTLSQWRFSIRGMLVLTALLSIVLAVGVNFPELVLAALAIAAPVAGLMLVFQLANFVTSERRPRIATLSWALLAMFFGLYAIAISPIGLVRADPAESLLPLAFFAVMASCCVVCIHRACRAIFRSRIRKSRAE
jgi:hypothetical protein